MIDRYDAFICPTLATTPIPAEFTWPDSEVIINGQPKTLIEENWSLTYPFNMLSRCPVISMPNGFAKSNVPTGFQIVGNPYDDASVFQIAIAHENIFPFQPNCELNHESIS